jgi:hypothetical protein
MPRIASLLLVVVLLGCGAERESFVDVAHDRSPLVQGFESYASRHEVVARLGPTLAVTVIEDSSLPADDRRPPYSIYKLGVDGYTHAGHEGVLELLFFNDRLQHASFHPANPATYLAALGSQGLSPVDGQTVERGNTVVWSAVDHRGRRYVAWADRRLEAQSQRWISRYS